VTLPVLFALGLTVASATTVPRAAEAPLPEGNAYVQGLVAKQKEREEAVNRYTYDVEELLEEQDANGATTSRHVRHYEVFHVKGRAVRKLVAEGGTPLGRARREEEEARVRREVEDILKGKAASDDPSLQLSTILSRYDFKAVGRQDQEGWPTLVLDWSARPGKRDIDGDALLRNLAGRLFVDEEEGQVVRAEIRNTSGLKFALGVGATVSTFGVVLEFRKVEDGLWLPFRIEAEAEARVLLVKPVRVRSTWIFSRFRRFDTDTQEEVGGPRG
jgi:hypothetical protein